MGAIFNRDRSRLQAAPTRPILAPLVTLLGALIVLGVTDHQLRRESQIDETLLHGESGISWVDEFLAKRAAEQKKLKDLLAAIGRARTPVEIFGANFALIEFETRTGHGDSRYVRDALVTITTTGRDDPQTITAWQERIRLAEQDGEPEEVIRPLVESYAAAVRRLAKGKDQFSRLCDVWRLATNHHADGLARAALEQVFRDYPDEPAGLAAYEALAKLYRQLGRTNELPALEAAIHSARVRQRELFR